MIMISSALKDYQAVIAVDSGHINVHETGAVEFTGIRFNKATSRWKDDSEMIDESCVNILMNIWCN